MNSCKEISEHKRTLRSCKFKNQASTCAQHWTLRSLFPTRITRRNKFRFFFNQVCYLKSEKCCLNWFILEDNNLQYLSCCLCCGPAHHAARGTPPVQLLYSFSNLLYGWSESPIRPAQREEGGRESGDKMKTQKLIVSQGSCSPD